MTDNEPVAWVVFASDGSDAATTCLNRDVAEVIAELHGWHVAPLYRKPTLTDEEREAIRRAADTLRFLQADYGKTQTEKDAHTLLELLERLKCNDH
jgi:stage III sporulation protein SpoIIIAA